MARLVLFLGAPAAQCHGECIGDLFALASHLAQHDAQGKRLASTASGWPRSIISASGWRKKSAVWAGSDIGKTPRNQIPIRRFSGDQTAPAIGENPVFVRLGEDLQGGPFTRRLHACDAYLVACNALTPNV